MKLAKPYNSYNLFFILERALLLDQRKGATFTSDEDSPSSPITSTVAAGYYGHIDLPPLPPRYQHLRLYLPANWYDPGRNKLNKRQHRKTQGGVPFREMAKTVADNWKAVDSVTKMYVEDVVKIIKKPHAELVAKNNERIQKRMREERAETAKRVDDGLLKLKKSKTVKSKQVKDQVTPRPFSSLPCRLPHQESLTQSIEPAGPTTPGRRRIA